MRRHGHKSDAATSWCDLGNEKGPVGSSGEGGIGRTERERNRAEASTTTFRRRHGHEPLRRCPDA
jgi:hypothetical protein